MKTLLRRLTSSLFVSLLFLVPLAPAQAELSQIDDVELRSVYAQAMPTDEEREPYQDIGEGLSLVLLPVLGGLNLGLNISLEGGITGALFGINGNSETGFIGQALGTIEKSFR
ncbi:MAG TPA: hypothetical protein DCZ03_11345 [Gammaproteobacteria bacterium]|nr:hypothetical protein [Gammaproteobacteria bacterium]